MNFSDTTLNFGDYILFQEYKQINDHKASKPILAIYLGCFVADQAIGFNYVRWINDNHIVYITNEYVTNYPTCKEVSGVENHIEWDDYIDILGQWDHKPKWFEIIKSYRKQKSMEKKIGFRYILKGYLRRDDKDIDNVEFWEIPVEWKNNEWYHFNTNKPIDNSLKIQSYEEQKI